MDYWMAGLQPEIFALAVAITVFAGFVKGAVGFAMPMIMISAFSSFLTPDIALAGLILPTVLANVSQALRQGISAAWLTSLKYRRFLIATVLLIPVSAQFVHAIPQPVFLFLLGLPITAFAALQLAGRSLAIKLAHRNRAEWALGTVAGLYGGVAGVWGPPLLVYLLSVDIEKKEAIRVQGVIFLIGSVVLLASHLQSGLMNAVSLPFSAALVGPAVIGLVVGSAVQNRLDQQRFRRWTQALLVLTGLNLMRRAMMM